MAVAVLAVGRRVVASDLPLVVAVDAVVPLEVFTLRYALAVLGAHSGNKSRAARALGVSRFALQRMCKRAETLGMAVL